jgi:chromosome segregation ATPase
VVEGPGTSTFSGVFNGEHQADVEKARKMVNGPFLWFTRDGKSYIVTDPAIIASIQKMNEPIRALGAQQEALGKQQEVLGKQQEALARDAQMSIKVRLPDLSKEMADLNATMAKMKDEQLNLDTQKFADLEAKIKAETDQELSPEKLAELQSKLAGVQAQWNSKFTAEFEARMADLQARLGALEGEAGAREGQFGEQEGKIGEEEGKLGEQEGRIGEQEGKLSEDMDRQVQKIIRDALASGKARPVQ